MSASQLLPLDPLFVVHGEGTKIFRGVWGMTPFSRCLLENDSPDTCPVMADEVWEPVKEFYPGGEDKEPPEMSAVNPS